MLSIDNRRDLHILTKLNNDSFSRLIGRCSMDGGRHLRYVVLLADVQWMGGTIFDMPEPHFPNKKCYETEIICPDDGHDMHILTKFMTIDP